MKKRLLLINPWITDVAAYDMWAWPLGLLYWASRLREWGFQVALVDCMDRFHPALRGLKQPTSRQFGTGKYFAQPFEEQPEPARQAKRVFRRHGLPLESFEQQLNQLEDPGSEFGGKPDAILISSRMTYWYHGVVDAIGRCRAHWPETPIVLGGIYASLCPDHAQEHAGADFVFSGDAFKPLTDLLKNRFPNMASRIRPPDADPGTWPSPALDLCHSHASLPLLTSVGCPFKCSYCASGQLAPHFYRRSAESVFQEVSRYHHQWGTTDFAFYDDALLVNSAQFFEPFLDLVIQSGMQIRFHTPNGLHYWMIDEKLAEKMRQAGVETIRLSLESAQPDRLSGWNREAGGISAFRSAVGHLCQAGFSRSQVGVYIMAGMPGQSVGEIKQTIGVVQDAGADPKVNEYSPIPGTQEWKRALEISGQEIESEPLWQNNNLYYTRPESPFTHADFVELRKLSRYSDFKTLSS